MMATRTRAEMAGYGTDSSDDVDPNFVRVYCMQLMLGRHGHSGIGNRIPRFPGFGGDFPIPDSRSAGNRESGNGPFPDSAGNRESGSRFGEPGISWSAYRARQLEAT